MPLDIPRITVVKGDVILAEFDLARKQWLERMDALGREGWRQTLAAYRQFAGLERTEGTANNRGIFFIGDTHFGHANIIHYCARPFSFYYPDDMDRVLIRNWNSTVGPDSLVYHLGDLRYGRGPRPAAEYLAMLAGRIMLIRGNHDTDLPTDRIEVKDSFAIEHEGIQFLLVHDPLDTPEGFEGWVIHGHVHNNNLRRWPFINFILRTINVSVEAIGYTPISLDTICRLIREGAESGRIGIYRPERR
jgi:calcineurin-like phosphoesterase family protein